MKAYDPSEKFSGSDKVSTPSASDASKPLRVFKSKTTSPIGQDEPMPVPPMTTPESSKPSPTFVSKTTGPFGGPASKQVNRSDFVPDPLDSQFTTTDPKGGM